MKKYEVVVISLNNSHLRDTFNERFCDVDFRYYDAVVGNNSTKVFNIDQFFYKYNRIPRNGEIGCTLSHFNVIREFYQQSSNECLILLEDDAIPETDFFPFLDNLMIPQDKPYAFLLGHSKTAKSNLSTQRLQQPLTDLVTISKSTFGRNDRVTECGTVGYCINRKTAEIIHNMRFPFWLTDDWKFLSSLGIKVFHPQKPLIYEDLNSCSATGNKVYHKHDFCRNPLIIFMSILKSQLLSVIYGNNERSWTK